MDSSFPNIPLSKDNFINCNWEEVVNNSEEIDCNHYSRLFWLKSQEAEQQGNTQLQVTLAVLSGITSSTLKSESTEQPFYYMDFISGISNEYLAVLKEWVSEISDYELKGRIADIIWIRNRDYRMAQIAIDSYLEAAKLLDKPERWTLSVERIERAIRLAYQANQKTHKDKVIIYIESVLDKYNGEDLSFLSAKLMELLQEFKKGDPSKYAAISEKAARRAETEHNWHKARNYWEIAIGWHRKNQDDNQERSASLSYAETYVKEAEDKINQTPPTYLAASHFLIKAIEALTNIGGNQTRIEQIHKTLLDYQQRSTTELQSFSQQIDISDIAGQVIEQVKNKELHEALYILAFLFKPTNISEIKQQTQELITKSIFSMIFPPVYINDMGKIIGKNPSFEDEMYRTAIWYQQVQAQAIIEPARYQINLEHYVKVSDFYEIVANNPFVPRGREEIYARGLYAGLTGDFLIAAHLLIPQIEHSIRCLVKRRGNITSWLDKGIQDEYIMSVLFDKHEADLQAIFGEDIAFDVIGLLNRKGFGSNLRNLMAHGLLSVNGFYTPSVVYLWWLTLHLCYLPIISNRESSQTNEQE
ncbi:DUF4209 domain-containing protein [Nostoc sp. FACHB-190]|uniref:DUF4209 domain-containing protein n=1 Tax=Nostoc sp. FACHB-190 TaxID=2692838 RepID=UPI001689B569|nr:DUF4209 domain-containing protein [Nostoc sp. FACHB-190]MBD2302992.1 DUF4209 domain-containing protein [Nostoc sp. FACHB-190]